MNIYRNREHNSEISTKYPILGSEFEFFVFFDASDKLSGCVSCQKNKKHV